VGRVKQAGGCGSCVPPHNVHTTARDTLRRTASSSCFCC
jgi:hypothetical protein